MCVFEGSFPWGQPAENDWFLLFPPLGDVSTPSVSEGCWTSGRAFLLWETRWWAREITCGNYCLIFWMEKTVRGGIDNRYFPRFSGSFHDFPQFFLNFFLFLHFLHMNLKWKANWILGRFNEFRSFLERFTRAARCLFGILWQVC